MLVTCRDISTILKRMLVLSLPEERVVVFLWTATTVQPNLRLQGSGGRLLQQFHRNDASDHSTVCLPSLEQQCCQTSRTITIQDTTAPVLSCGSDPVDAMVAPQAVPVPVQASATDNYLPSVPVVDYIEERQELTREQACVNSYILNRKWSTKDVCDNPAVST
jgi:hypothetical protein